MGKERIASEGYEFKRCICEKDLPEICPFKKEEEFELSQKFFGHQFGVNVGYKVGDKLKSCFVSDKNNETHILQDLIDGGFVESKIRRTKTKSEEDFSEKEYYYIIYKVADHSSMKPTTVKNIDFCVNTSHVVECEVLLVDNDWDNVSRYLTVQYSTRGSFAMSFFSMMEDLEDTFEEMIEECTDGVVDRDDYKVFIMYDEFGEEIEVEIDGPESLLKRVVSMRVINIKTTIEEVL